MIDASSLLQRYLPSTFDFLFIVFSQYRAYFRTKSRVDAKVVL